VKAAVEVLVRRQVPGTDVAETPEPAALPELRVRADGEQEGDEPRHEQDNWPPPSHHASLLSKWKSGKVEKVVA
jgi:hypothetical protein